MGTNSNKNDNNEKSPWYVRNAPILAVAIAIFLLRMCHTMTPHP